MIFNKGTLMKLISTLFLLVLSMNVFASANCPSGTKMIAECDSTPVNGDSKFAADFLDSIAICSKGKTVYMVAEKNGQSEALPASAITRTGAVTYSYATEHLNVSLSISVRPSNSHNATLSANFTTANLLATSTYSCQMN